MILLATGSEIAICVQVHDALSKAGIRARVAVEQASTFGWERYVGARGRIIGMRTFGASAPLHALQRKFGFQPDRIEAAARDVLEGR